MASDKPVTNEIATISRDITRHHAYLNTLTPEDSLLRHSADRLQLYTEVLSDDQVKSAWEKRQRELTAAPWTVLAGDESARAEEAAEALKAELTAIGWNQITEYMQHGLFFGFAVAELLYEMDGSKVKIADIRPRNPRRFVFGQDGQPRLKTRSHWLDGEELPERKFWHFHAGGFHADDPYGQGLAHWLYWPVRFKKEGLAFWNEFLEKYGAPFILGKYPNGTSAQDQERLLESCRAVRRDLGMTLPEGMMVELVQTKAQGTPDHAALFEAMNAAILKVIVGQTMTTEDGSSRSQSETHADQQSLLVMSDAELIDESFNKGPARWWCEWNYGEGVASPRVVRLFEAEEDKKTAAETILTMQQAGWTAPQEQVDKIFGEGWEKTASVQGQAADKQAEFADPAPRDTADEIADEAEGDLDTAMTELLEMVRAVVEKTDSLEEAQAALLGIYPDLDPARLAEIMGQAHVLADLKGRDEAEETSDA